MISLTLLKCSIMYVYKKLKLLTFFFNVFVLFSGYEVPFFIPIIVLGKWVPSLSFLKSGNQMLCLGMFTLWINLFGCSSRCWGNIFRIIILYAFNDAHDRRDLWWWLALSLPFASWILCGEFNMVEKPFDKKIQTLIRWNLGKREAWIFIKNKHGVFDPNVDFLMLTFWKLIGSLGLIFKPILIGLLNNLIGLWFLKVIFFILIYFTLFFSSFLLFYTPLYLIIPSSFLLSLMIMPKLGFLVLNFIWTLLSYNIPL